jgi:DNA adenine methylase
MKPFIKWVGGKTQILNDVLTRFPKEINTYYEPFLGGGSVLLGILSEPSINISGQVIASDINPHLIKTYQAIQSNPVDVHEKFSQLVKEYTSCPNDKGNKKPKDKQEALQAKESYYYWLRSQYNIEQKPEQFIFLNKTCFRGLHREGPNGFNVPFGNYKTPPTLQKEHLMDISKLIQKVQFKHQTFQKTLEDFKEGDFTYLDPPYAPINNTSFTAYTKDSFNHGELFTIAKRTTFLLSNADVPMVNEAFRDGTYHVDTVLCRRSINSKDPAEKVNEVLIYN